ncbi:hypothetical protein ACFQ7N_31945 [Streptomyces niveus]|uniref:hypothetical protein n=1 Tax=Streptomyces niveus TaxID=193462 RepID=UPI0036CBE525
MSLADLTFDRWRALDRDAAHRLALEAARSADGRLLEFDGAPHLGDVLHRAVIERGGERFALIPGGEAVCGGYGAFVGWLPLATANRNPGMAEFLNGPEGEDMGDEFGVRPVLDLG